METFFSRIKAWFSQDMGGRYLSVVLAELINEDRRVAKAIFPDLQIGRKQLISAVPEAAFVGNTKARKRRADIEIRLGVEPYSQILGQIEIKYEDHKLDSVISQVEDYVTHQRKHSSRAGPLYFTYLTKHEIPRAHQVRLDAHARKQNIHLRRMTYRQLHRALRTARGPFVEAFCRHLEEIGMNYKRLEKRDFDALQMLILKSIGAPHAHGFGRKRGKTSIERVPLVLKMLFENAQILADRFYVKHRPSFGNRFSIDFKSVPEFSPARLQKQLNENGDETSMIPSDRTLSKGHFWIGAAGRMPGHELVYLMLGCYFSVNLSKKRWVRGLFAQVYGNGLRLPPDEECYSEMKFASFFPSEDVADRQLSRLAKAALLDAAKYAVNRPTKGRITVLARAIHHQAQ